jgi:hypothetical protein
MTKETLSPDDLAAAAVREVHEFHAFLAEWFSGRIAPGDTVLGEQRRRFDPGLQYIRPSGGVGDWAMIENVLESTHGGEPSIKIEVRHAVVRRADAASVLVTYEEHQTGGDEDNGRLTTALFVPKSDAPNGVGWFHVHEVWLVSA